DHTVTATALANGSISPSGSVGVFDDSSQMFAIIASPGYHVRSVTVDGAPAGVDTSYTFYTLTTNHTITASFGKSPIVGHVYSEFDETLVPGVAPGSFVGLSNTDRGYVTEISPTSSGTGGQTLLRNVIEPESNGSSWSDILRLQISPTDDTLDV